MKDIIPFSHFLLQENVTKNDITIDMTMGNGNDTLFLSKISKYVYSFDIQEQAIKNTEELLINNNVNNVKLILDSHINVVEYVKEAKGIIFNLGYLPGADKNITTKSETTIDAIVSGLKILSDDGICIIVCYPGHNEGKIESEEITKYLSGLDQKIYKVLQYQFINQKNSPPFLLAIKKKKL